jgi:hypothetical protein
MNVTLFQNREQLLEVRVGKTIYSVRPSSIILKKDVSNVPEVLKTHSYA